MRLDGLRRSKNVDDRRGMSPKAAVGGGLGVIVIAMVAMFLGADKDTVAKLMGGAKNKQAQQQKQGKAPGKDDQAREFIEKTLFTTEAVFGDLFRENPRFVSHMGVHRGAYKEPELEIFSDNTVSKCGPAQSAMGPFYCPGDQKVYIDPTFFRELAAKHDAPGDFAQAYVIAHEVGHHVQRLIGYNQLTNQNRKAAGSKAEANRWSVRLELQADYLAGVWANTAHKKFGILERGDIQEAAKAAIQIGDDTLQKKFTGKVIPEGFTHGTGKQRYYWFQKGIESGDFAGADELFKLPYNQL